jgi:peptide deformylase
MEVVLFPDPILRRKAATVTRFDDDLRRTAAEMHETMAKAKGVGLAAPQVGLSIRLLVLNPTGRPEDALTLVNPKLALDKGEALGDEGCLSFPGIWSEIARAPKLVVEAQDLDGKEIRLELADYVARIVQHEFDHLDGILFIDRMSPADKLRTRKALRSLEDKYQEKLAATGAVKKGR